MFLSFGMGILLALVGWVSARTKSQTIHFLQSLFRRTHFPQIMTDQGRLNSLQLFQKYDKRFPEMFTQKKERRMQNFFFENFSLPHGYDSVFSTLSQNHSDLSSHKTFACICTTRGPFSKHLMLFSLMITIINQ